MKTLIRRRVRRRLIWVFTVCLCPINGTQGLYGLTDFLKIRSSTFLSLKFYHVFKNDWFVKICSSRCPAGCDCFGLTIDCSGKDECFFNKNRVYNITRSMSVPSSTRKLDVSTNPQAFHLMNIRKQNLFLLTHLNLSHCGISEFDNGIFISMVKLKVLDISYNKLWRLTSDLFSSQLVLEYLYLVGNFESITFEARSFSGLSRLHLELAELHIERISAYAFATLNLTELKIYGSQIDTFEANALGELRSESIYLNSSKINYFSEGMFDGVQGIKMLKTDAHKYCCVRPRTLPEDSCFPGKDEFSSCDDLIRNEVLRPLVWLIGLFIIFSNVSSILYRVIKQREQLKRTYGFFVTNLAVSDGLMGFYLLIIAVADAYFRKTYIFHDENWRYSGWCKLAGILSAISNESSMLFVGLITLDRIILIKYPLGEVRFVKKYARMLTVLAWCIPLILAVFPVALYPVFEGKFYSLSGVCLALPITRARPPGHAYSVGVFIGFNSVAYALIAFGQWLIYREIRISSTSVAESRSITSRDAKVARRLLMVAVTDLLCWLPVTILGKKLIEPETDKTNKTFRAPIEYSDQPTHPVFPWRSTGSQ